MSKPTKQPKRQMQPRDRKGRFTKHQRLALDPSLVKRLGEGRSVLARWLDDSIPWVVINRGTHSDGAVE